MCFLRVDRVEEVKVIKKVKKTVHRLYEKVRDGPRVWVVVNILSKHIENVFYPRPREKI